MTNLPELCLAGKVALVTGAGRGIGASIALNLAKAGADVIVNDLDRQAANETAGSIETSGQHALSIQSDVGDEGAVQSLVAEASRWRGHLDILVCNAGISETESIITLSPDTWERVIRTNLTGTFLCAKYCIMQMKEQGRGGRLIFIGSGVTHQGALLGHVAYAASKGGIHSMARTLARTGAPLGITSNVIAPGSTDTPLLRQTHSPSYIESLDASIPLGLASPDDIGSAAVFLASDAAKHITGITLDVNGGQIIR